MREHNGNIQTKFLIRSREWLYIVGNANDFEPRVIYKKVMKKYVFAVVAFVAVAAVVSANHSWGGYHWARTSNPFTLKLGDNVTSAWKSYLGMASSDWSASSTVLLKTLIVSGATDPRRCRATNGRVEVCNAKYGANGWLGIASIWVSGSHITQGTVKLNDTYFNTTQYNTPAWRQFVTCQEVGHTFGLDHQDVTFGNPNLGTCMDYTNDPDGTIYGQLSNLHPNAHDYEELGIIYAHLDGFTTLISKKLFGAAFAKAEGKVHSGDTESDFSEPQEWGKVIRHDQNGRGLLHERDLGNGEKLFTFVIWAN